MDEIVPVDVGHGLLVELLLAGARLLRLAAPAREVRQRGLVVGLRRCPKRYPDVFVQFTFRNFLSTG